MCSHLILLYNNYIFCLQHAVSKVPEKVVNGVKSSRKNRDHRCRSQDWPDVPDVGKIEENNPEILAQKILETGRQIEAGKIRETSRNKEPPVIKQPSHVGEKYVDFYLGHSLQTVK